MPNDSMQYSTSGHIKQANNQVSPVRSYQCSHCTLIFKAKAYLFQHLNKVHGFDVEAALRNAGLKFPRTNNADDADSSSGDGLKCQHCDFKARSQDVLNEHEEQCLKNSDNPNVIGTVILCENPDTKIVISTNQLNEAAGGEQIPSPTSKGKCTLNLKDVKIYKRPLQTNTTIFAAPSGSSGKPPAKLADNTKGTLILQESPSSSGPNNSGVFKVTAKSMIDISKNVSTRFLRDDHLLMTDPRKQKSVERFKETGPKNKRSTDRESSESRPAKKAKSDKDETNLPTKEDTSEQQSSSSPTFSFDVSEDEEEKKGRLVTRDTESPKVYFCKHCDYSDVSIRCVSAHYENDHPYIRYNAAYLRDSANQSAAFRCLKCPVEFLSTADLKRHYMKNHPGAPDVFTMKSRELCLVFKCFVCPFTTSVLKALKEHYKEKHPTHEVDNSLLYCQYSLAECQEESSELNTCDKMSSSVSKSAHTPVKNAASPQHPTSKGADVALYECNSCNFSHKSAVVMHVHYQKSHPDEAITIDKIKQAARVTSQRTPEKSSNSVTVKEKSTTLKNISDFLKKTKDKAELSKQKTISSYLLNPKHVPEASKNQSGSPKTEKVESVEDRSTKPKRERITGMDSLSHSSPDENFYCHLCSYTSINVRSVVGHHNAKHVGHAVTNIEEIVRYSREVRKEELQSEAQTSKSTPPCHSKTGKQVEVCSETEVHTEEDDAAHASLAGFNAYARAENLFYCQRCNFGNPTVKGVLNHQAVLHQQWNFNRAGIIQHTTVIRDEIEKSKSHAKELSFSTRLPLPLMNEGDENKFFCHFCNYRHRKIIEVVKHYSKRHRGFELKSPQILQYTFLVLERTQKLPQKAPANREVNEKSLGNIESRKKLAKSCSVSPSVTASQSQRTLRCYKCSYSNQSLHQLKRHIGKAHNVHRSITAVLRVCFKQGTLQPGYHCVFCLFSHEEAAVVYKHHLEQHPGFKSSLEFISARLYVGPKPFSTGKAKLKYTDGTGDGDGDGSLPAQRSRLDETEKYSCSACSFKSRSMSTIARHYRGVHSRSTKEGILDLLSDKKASANSQVEDHDEVPGSFDSYQVPLEFDRSFDEPTVLTCPYCPATFNRHHGLKVHLGMKHPVAAAEKVEEQEEEHPKRVDIFKCPHCTYVHTVHQGVMAHCQMKHPGLTSRPDSLHVDTKHSPNWDYYCKRKVSGAILRFSGHMCNTCPQICATLDKLNEHRAEEHNETVASTVPASKLSAVSKIQQSRAYSTQGSVSKASFLSKKIYARIRCQHCSYVCSSKDSLSRHLLVHHKSTVSKDSLHRCVLCSASYFSKKHLAKHYSVKHGKDAYSEFPVENPEPTSPDRPKTQKPQNTPDSCQPEETTEEDKIFVYKCPRCPYVNASHHGTLTHCQMKHPTLTARADELQTGEVLLTDLVMCTRGRSFNERGYMCKKCPQIHVSLAKLSLHCYKDHNRKIFGHSAETRTENRPVHGSEESEAASLKNETSEVSLSETGHSPQLGFPETPQSNSLSGQNKELLHKCHICSYAGCERRYLHSHYKKTHKMDAQIYKLLEKNNNQKSNEDRPLPESAESEESANYICKKCPNLMFDSSQLLIDHYSTFHRPDCKLDFKVLSLGSKKHKSTGLYRCIHCKTQLNGIRKLCYHMERHRMWNKAKFIAAKTNASPVITSTPEPEPVKLCRQDETPTSETVEEPKKWTATPAETLALPASPLPSPPKLTDGPELESEEDKRTCKLCGRTFMSLTGLRSHEHSHAALAAIKKRDHLPTYGLKQEINKYVRYKAGNVKPFLCSVCPYKTTVLGLWWSHFMKKHQDVLVDPAESDDNEGSADREPPYSSEKTDDLPELDEEAELTEELLYSEPPDVLRQLNHYSLMTQSSTKSKLQESNLPESRLLRCELCSFSSLHLSKIRRHYLNRHGAKILKCKDCNFFTGLRKTLKMHMETGHTTSQSEPAHQKDFRCPFCLYQTNNKNNMIDHIVLHREERVVPVEVRRPKLSRYLRGVVFRCHKCTFSSGIAENLRLHMMKHDDVKPYKCRLCYFDCTQLSDLEAHLSDKHQVVRNHKLVGQVSLDQLEARRGGMLENEEDPLFNLEQHNDDDSEDVETEEFVTDSDEVENLAENNTREKVTLQIEDAHQKQEQDRDEESPAKSSVLDTQYENTKPNTTVQNSDEQDPQKQEGTGFMPDTAGGQELGGVGQTVREGSDADIQSEDHSGPEKETNKNHAQPKLRDGEDGSITLTPQKEEAAEGSSTTYFKTAEETQDHKVQMKALEHRKLDIETKVEDDILRHILLLDEDGSHCKIEKKASQERTVKIEPNIDAKGVDKDLSDIPLLDKEGSITLAQKPKNQVNTQALEKINHAQGSNTIERHFLTLSPNSPRRQLGHKNSLGFSYPNCKREQVHDQKICEEAPESYGEMPILENEYLKEEMQLLGCPKEEGGDDHPEEQLDKEAEMITEDNEKRRKDEDSPRVHKGAFTATEGAAEALRSTLTEEKPYTCEFCGRNFMNSSELKRHIMRHGM